MPVVALHGIPTPRTNSSEPRIQSRLDDIEQAIEECSTTRPGSRGVRPCGGVNLPKDANAYDQQRDCKLRNCIIEAVAWYKQVLTLPNAPRNEKRTAPRFVAHLVGDLDQPLHADSLRTVAELMLM
jgi:hypothetical protein